jgi:hypothetical protein
MQDADRLSFWRYWGSQTRGPFATLRMTARTKGVGCGVRSGEPRAFDVRCRRVAAPAITKPRCLRGCGGLLHFFEDGLGCGGRVLGLGDGSPYDQIAGSGG